MIRSRRRRCGGSLACLCGVCESDELTGHNRERTDSPPSKGDDEPPMSPRSDISLDNPRPAPAAAAGAGAGTGVVVARSDGEGARFVVCHEFLGEQQGDLPCAVGDMVEVAGPDDGPDWRLVRAVGSGRRGYVPAEILQPCPAPPGPNPTTALDLLRSRGAIPAGFRASTLADIAADPPHTLPVCLGPRLAAGGLAYTHLVLDETGAVAPVEANTTRTAGLLEARDIPEPAAVPGVTVVSRHVHVVLFDRRNFIGNVLTVRANWTKEQPRTWSWSHLGRLPLASDLDGTLLVRTNTVDPSVCILFELCCTLRDAAGTLSEMSCGWSQLPLLHTRGGPATAKTYDLRVHAGTPFEAAAMMDTAPSSPKTMRTAPRLMARLADLKKDPLAQCQRLPEPLLLPLAAVPVATLYRETLAHHVAARPPLGTALQFHPALSLFSRVAARPPALHAFLQIWTASLKALKKSERQDPAVLRAWFAAVLADKMLPLLSVLEPLGATADPALLTEAQALLARHQAAASVEALQHEPRAGTVAWAPLGTAAVMATLLPLETGRVGRW
eukprot:m.197242 g.197242  ORF g.197242 m.197242 type:complete len:556 (-) comp15472_c0_seq17:135-1802(-)